MDYPLGEIKPPEPNAQPDGFHQPLDSREQTLESILDSLLDGVISYDREWRYTYVNETAVQMSGLTKEQLLGKTIYELFPERVNTPVFEEFQRIMREGKPAQFVYFSPGAQRWLRTNCYPSPAGMLTFFVDITEERKLNESAQFFTTLTQNMVDAVITSDINQIITGWNKGAEALYGWTEREVIGKRVQDVIRTEFPDNPDGRRQGWETLNTAGHWQGEVIQTCKNGDLIDVFGSVAKVEDAQGKLVGLVAINRNISGRKRIEEALRRSAETNAFRAALSDVLRPLTNPLEIQAAAARLLGQYLKANRVIYAEIQEDDFIVHQDYSDGVPSLRGSYRLADFGPTIVNAARRGETIVVADVATYPDFTEAERAAYTAINIRSYASVILVKDGKSVAGISVQSLNPRNWTAEEITLIEETAEWTWAAVERAHAETELRASETKLAEELADMQQLQHISSQLIQENNVDALYEKVLDAAIAITHADMGSMQMLYPENNELFLLAQKGFASASASFWEWVGIDTTSTCAEALRTGARVVVPDVETVDYIMGTADLDFFRLSGIRAVQTTPLISRSGRIVGMISTHWREIHEPSERELRLIDVLARQAADLLENAQIEELRDQQERELAIVEERQRFARELHDGVSQALFSTNIMLETVLRRWKQKPENALAQLEQIHQLTTGTIAEMRMLLLELRPESVTKAKLSDLLVQLIQAIHVRHGITVSLDIDDAQLTLPEDVHFAFYRIAQESLNNIGKHGQAKQARVRLRAAPDYVEMVIVDDGAGFDVNGKSAGFGLTSMRERANSVGAALHIQSKRRIGTRIRLRWGT